MDVLAIENQNGYLSVADVMAIHHNPHSQEITVSATRPTTDHNVTQLQPRGPMLRPDLDMTSILAAPQHREARPDAELPWVPYHNGENGLWWA